MERSADPTFVTPERARQELGGCSNTYLYELLGKGVLRSVNPGGRRRLIEFASIRELLRETSKKPAVAQKKRAGAA
jgi:excisionase family DNA binding protein